MTVILPDSRLIDIRLGNTKKWYLTPRRDIDMRVPDEVRQCVVFVGLRVPRLDGQLAIDYKGTAFIVGIESSARKGNSYAYLVTARHVANELEGKPFVVRFNTVDGGSELVEGQGTKWWYHPEDDKVDVAVVLYAPDQTKFEFKIIPSSMFLTDEIVREKGIGTGDEVFITGLFAHLTGTARNLPIIRIGNIAMMPDEPVPTSIGNIEAYLIEARSIGGLSGSPAFVRGTVGFGVSPFYLMGLMHGHWDIPLGNMNDIVDAGLRENVNMGIAIVVPAKKILEVLDQPVLAAIRRGADEILQKEGTIITPDGHIEIKTDQANPGTPT